MNEKKIMVEKEKVLKTAPALEEVIRGTFREVLRIPLKVDTCSAQS